MRIRLPRLTLGLMLILIAVASVPIAIVAPWYNPRAPKAVVVGPSTFDSGTAPVGVYRRHSWTIRNEGRAPLVLVVSTTSPYCGLSLWEGENRTVPPGGETVIQMTYETPEVLAKRFSSFADLATNEEPPTKIRLQVEGVTGRAESKTPPSDRVPVRVKP